MTDKKNFEVKFAPGAFDGFEGTQEELDELIKEITDFFASHSKEEILELSEPLNVEGLTEEELLRLERRLDGDTKDLH